MERVWIWPHKGPHIQNHLHHLVSQLILHLLSNVIFKGLFPYIIVAAWWATESTVDFHFLALETLNQLQIFHASSSNQQQHTEHLDMEQCLNTESVFSLFINLKLLYSWNLFCSLHETCILFQNVMWNFFLEGKSIEILPDWEPVQGHTVGTVKCTVIIQ